MDACETARLDIQNLEDLRSRLIEDYNIAHGQDGWPLPTWYEEELAEIDEELESLYRFEAINC